MECKMRIADDTEIDLLVDLRIKFVKDIHPEYTINKINELTVATKKYINEQYNKNMYVGFIGEVESEIVCTTALLIYDYPPLYSQEYRKIGHVLNFFTDKKYRRKGFGIKMMDFVKEYSKHNNIYKLDLSATEDGYELYKKCGYSDSERNMELVL